MGFGKAEMVRGWNGKIQNVYRWEVLYQEVWNYPITEVAKKYAVSDEAIHKVCRFMGIPIPPVGYWTKAKADWYDPIVAAKDAVFGRRNHKESAEKKTLCERR